MDSVVHLVGLYLDLSDVLHCKCVNKALNAAVDSFLRDDANFERLLALRCKREFWKAAKEVDVDFVPTCAKRVVFAGRDFREAVPALLAASARGAGVCGKVWGPNESAYQCLTCALDATCVVCVECFRAGDHTGHKYKLIRTSGGCCDCGDPDAWKESGFCSEHQGPRADHNAVGELPLWVRRRGGPVIAAVVKTVVSLLANPNGPTQPETFMADRLIKWLCDTVVKKWGLRAVVSVVLCSESRDAHRSATRPRPSVADPPNSTLLSRLIECEPKMAAKQREALHALIYALIVSVDFKRHLLVSTESQHSLLRFNPERPGETERHCALTNFGVQLLTVPQFARLVCRQDGHLEGALQLLLELFQQAKVTVGSDTQGVLSAAPNAPVDVVNVGHGAVSGLYVGMCCRNVEYALGVKQVAAALVRGKLEGMDVKSGLLLSLVECMVLSSQMCPVSRTASGLPQASPGAQHAIVIELQLQALMRLVLDGFSEVLKAKNNDVRTAKGRLHVILHTAQRLVQAYGLEADQFDPFMFKYDPNQGRVSFHHPLHRFIAHIVATMMQSTNLTAYEWLDIPVDTSKHTDHHKRVTSALWLLMEHPVRLLVLCSEARAKGALAHTVVANVAAFYRSVEFVDACDADLFLLQLGAMVLDPTKLLHLLTARFSLSSLVAYKPEPEDNSEPGVPTLSPPQAAMLEDFLVLIVRVVNTALLVQRGSVDQVRRDVVQLLGVGAQKHSAVHQFVVKANGEASHDILQDTLPQVATFLPPTQSSSGKFQLNNDQWPAVDPYYPRFSKRQQQEVEKGYALFRSRLGQQQRAELPEQPCPKFQNLKSMLGVLRLLHSDAMATVLFVTVHNAVYALETSVPSASLWWTPLITCLHLISLGIQSAHEYKRFLRSQNLRSAPPSPLSPVRKSSQLSRILSRLKGRQQRAFQWQQLVMHEREDEAERGPRTMVDHLTAQFSVQAESLRGKVVSSVLAELSCPCLAALLCLCLRRADRWGPGDDSSHPTVLLTQILKAGCEKSERVKRVCRSEKAAVPGVTVRRDSSPNKPPNADASAGGEDDEKARKRALAKQKQQEAMALMRQQMQNFSRVAGEEADKSDEEDGGGVADEGKGEGEDEDDALREGADDEGVRDAEGVLADNRQWPAAVSDELQALLDANDKKEAKGETPCVLCHAGQEGGTVGLVAYVQPSSLTYLAQRCQVAFAPHSSPTPPPPRPITLAHTRAALQEGQEADHVRQALVSRLCTDGVTPSPHPFAGDAVQTLQPDSPLVAGECAGRNREPRAVEEGQRPESEGRPVLELLPPDNTRASVAFCSHTVHYDCLQRHLEKSRPVPGLYQPGEFACPACRTLSNAMMPTLPTALPTPSPLHFPAVSSRGCLRSVLLRSQLGMPMERFFADAASSTSKVCAGHSLVIPLVSKVWRRDERGGVARVAFSNTVLTCSRRGRTEVPAVVAWSFLASTLQNEVETVEIGSRPAPDTTPGPLLPSCGTLWAMRKLWDLAQFAALTNHSRDHEPLWDGLQGTPCQQLSPLQLDPLRAVCQLAVRWQGDVLTGGYFFLLLRACFSLCLFQTCVYSQFSQSQSANAPRAQAQPSPPGHAKHLHAADLEGLFDAVADHLREQGGGDIPQPNERWVLSRVLPFMRQCAVVLAVLNQGARDSDSFFAESAQPPQLDGLNALDAPAMFDRLSQLLLLPPARVVLEDVAWLVPRWLSCARLFMEASGGTRVWLNRPWELRPVGLFPLQQNFHDLHLALAARRCPACSRTPELSALCLLCGAIVCVASPCCTLRGWGEATQHAAWCAGGVGAFLVLGNSRTLVLRYGRVSSLPSLYLDEHGEEDANLRRGCPLFLNAGRCKQLVDWLRLNRLDTDTVVARGTVWNPDLGTAGW